MSGIICGERVGAEKTKNVALKGRWRERSQKRKLRGRSLRVRSEEEHSVTKVERGLVKKEQWSVGIN